jgi:hypothetical protein
MIGLIELVDGLILHSILTRGAEWDVRCSRTSMLNLLDGCSNAG